MIKECGCKHVILGHSERRSLFGETSQIVNAKVLAALEARLHPILCIGETLEERDGGKIEQVLESQLRESLAEVGARRVLDCVIAYEPVWAIGTGRTAIAAAGAGGPRLHAARCSATCLVTTWPRKSASNTAAA